MGLLELATDLRQTIESEELDIVYQPLFAAGGGIVGFEALSRWNHPTRGAVPPDVFIPLAEHAQLMEALTRTVLRRSARQCAQWRAAGHDVSIAVNLAPSSLRGEPIIELVAAELEAAGLEAGKLTLEITEGRLADGSEPRTAQGLQGLHRLGVRLSIDDFGTGYSSLAYLKELPVDELKIDRSFVAHLDTDGRDVAIVRSLVELAKVLHLDVVAEGVESEAIAASGRDAGCDVLQGFGLGRPQSADHASALLGAQAGSEQTAGTPRPPAAGRRLTIALAESNPRTRAGLRRALEAEGHDVHVSDNGAHAITKARAGQVDMVIFSELLTGQLTAAQASSRLRSTGYSGPIVILFPLSRRRVLLPRRFPVDVWPVARDDWATLLQLVEGCA